MEINSGINIDVNYAGDKLIAYGPAASTRSDSGLITATAGISSPSDVYTTSGGSLNITLGAGPVTAVAIPAGSTLAAVRDAINASGTGVRAEVIDANVNRSPADYRIMLSATPGSPAADISVAVTTTDAAGTGLNRVASAAMTSVVSPDKTVIGAMSILKTAIEMGDKPAIQRSLAALDALALSVREKQSEVGVRLNRADLEKNYLTSRDTDVTNAVADKLTMSEVDIAKVTVDAQQRQTALSSLRSISSGFLQTSLFDFLK
jgi:flagellin-like hook-associated protein FlgL